MTTETQTPTDGTLTIKGEHDSDEEPIYLALIPCTGEANKVSLGVAIGYRDDFLCDEQWGMTINKQQAQQIAEALMNWVNS